MLTLHDVGHALSYIGCKCHVYLAFYWFDFGTERQFFIIHIFIPILTIKAFDSPQMSCMHISIINMYFSMFLVKSNKNKIDMVGHFSLTCKIVALSLKRDITQPCL